MEPTQQQQQEQPSLPLEKKKKKRARRSRYQIPGQLDRAKRMHELLDELFAHKPHDRRIRAMQEALGLAHDSVLQTALFAKDRKGNGKVKLLADGTPETDAKGIVVGASGPRRELALAICHVFHVNIEWLWDGVGEKYQQRVNSYDLLMKTNAHLGLSRYLTDLRRDALDQYHALKESFEHDPTYRAARLNEELRLKFDQHLEQIWEAIEKTTSIIQAHLQAINGLFTEGAERQAQIITHVLLVYNVHESAIKELDLPLIDELKKHPALATQFFNEVQGIYNCLESYPTLIQAPEFLIVETRNYVREALKNMPIDLDRFFAQVPMDELQKLYLNKATPDDLISLLILGQTA